MVQIIAGGEGDDAFRAGQNFLRLHAFVGVALEVMHFALAILGEPGLEFRGVIGRSGSGEMAIVEAQFQGALADGFFHEFAA